jgi:hypothetical protein
MNNLDFSRRLKDKKNNGQENDTQEQKTNLEYFEEGDDLNLDFEFVSSDDEDSKAFSTIKFLILFRK